MLWITYYNSLIAFDKRVTFGLQSVQSLPYAYVYVALCIFSCIIITQLHVHTMQQTHTQGCNWPHWSQNHILLSKAIKLKWDKLFLILLQHTLNPRPGGTKIVLVCVCDSGSWANIGYSHYAKKKCVYFVHHLIDRNFEAFLFLPTKVIRLLGVPRFWRAYHVYDMQCVCCICIVFSYADIFLYINSRCKQVCKFSHDHSILRRNLISGFSENKKWKRKASYGKLF